MNGKLCDNKDTCHAKGFVRQRGIPHTAIEWNGDVYTIDVVRRDNIGNRYILPHEFGYRGRKSNWR